MRSVICVKGKHTNSRISFQSGAFFMFRHDATLPDLEQGMGIFEDRLKYMRCDRQLRMMKRALRARGLPILLAEQNIKLTDLIFDRWFAIDKGGAGHERDAAERAV